MKKIFEEIWKLALPYQDKRDDTGHAEITTNYAIQLLKLEKANEDVVVPAIILHDTGWSQLSQKERMLIFDHQVTKKQKIAMRYKHQEAGVEIGKKILEKVHYPSDLIPKILEIIFQHDTRDGFISSEEGLVRDADKLWRFSKTGFDADIICNRFDFWELYDKLKERRIEKEGFFYSKKAKKLAYKELEKRKKEYLKNNKQQ